MNEYKRWISYLYEYVEEEKKENVGFLRVEIRGPNCRIRIGLAGNRTDRHAEADVFLLAEEKEGVQEIPLGILPAWNVSREGIFQTRSGNVAGSGRDWKAFSGVKIRCEKTGREYRTYWDDRIQQGEARRREEEREREEELARETLGSEEDGMLEENIEDSRGSMLDKLIKDNLEEDVSGKKTEHWLTEKNLEEHKENWQGEISEVSTDSIQRENVLKGTEESTLGEILDQEEESSLQKKVQEKEESQTEDDVLEADVECWLEEETTKNPPESPLEENFPAEATEVQKSEKFMEENEASSNFMTGVSEEPLLSPASSQPLSPGFADITAPPVRNQEPQITWAQLQGIFPRILPFGPADTWEVMRIGLQDIGRLPREHWVLGANEFVIHGYYDHRHLALIRDGSGEFCYLGVPGNAGIADRRVAELFGFRQYRPADSGGYWLTRIKI